MSATRKGNILTTESGSETFHSIAKAKKASLALQKSGTKVTRLEHKQTEKTIPSRQKSPFAKR